MGLVAGLFAITPRVFSWINVSMSALLWGYAVLGILSYGLMALSITKGVKRTRTMMSQRRRVFVIGVAMLSPLFITMFIDNWMQAP